MMKRLTFPVFLIVLGSFLSWAFIPMPGPARAQFVDQSTYGGTSGGAANVQTITIANYSANTPGVVLRFVPGFTNTGPTTLNVSGVGAVAVVRPSSIGNAALSGGEITAGELTCVTYNGTAYQLSCNVDMTPIGRTIEYRGSSTPRGALIEDGSCVSRTTFAPLFSVIGTNYGACDGSTTFGVPDSRGTAFASLDNQGANGAANRITSGASGCNGTVIGICGTQTATITQTYLPAVGLAVNVAGTISTTGPVNVGLGSSTTGGGGFAFNYPTGASNVNSSGNMAGTTAALGSGGALPILPPLSLGRRAIKF